jgi:hypothetical protein
LFLENLRDIRLYILILYRREANRVRVIPDFVVNGLRFVGSKIKRVFKSKANDARQIEDTPFKGQHG